MDEKQFKKTFKSAACTRPPWEGLIPKEQREEVLRTIREESLKLHGEYLDECPKRKTCFTKNCQGRPLPTLSPTAKPYIEQLKKTHNVVGNELYLDNCGSCVLKNSCKQPCAQVNDYLNRDRDKEVEFVFSNDLDEKTLNESLSRKDKAKTLDLELPWDILTTKRAEVIKRYLYQERDFLAVAQELGLTDQAEARYIFYSSLTKMSEYGIMRKFLKEHRNDLTSKQILAIEEVYINNKTLTETAKKLDISTAAVSDILTRVVNKFNIKWSVFVKKEGNKVVYDVPLVLK